VIIVHRDRAEDCARAIAAFRQQAVAVDITVVDNGSAPDELEHLQDLVADVEVVQMGFNAGFGPGANAGLRRWLAQGRGEWAVVAPHDAVPEPGCVAHLLAEVECRPAVGLVSAEFGPGFEMVPAVDWVIGGYFRPAVRGCGWQETDYAHGTMLLARRAALIDVGLFDERYFAYCEEVDLSLRARRRGWRVGIVWGAVVANERLPDRTIADYLQLRNTLLLVRTHFGWYPAAVRGIYAAGQLVTRPSGSRRGWPWHQVKARALLDFARGRFGPPPIEVVAAAARNLACGGDPH
jgi:N-acetylglucosaminyl-diphospho-decaprenol L-rhamnosyltransferase